MADVMEDEKVLKETHARSTNAHTAKWKLIPPKYVGRECSLKTTQTPARQSPPATMNKLAMTVDSLEISSPPAFTSNVPRTNPTKSTKVQHQDGLLKQEIVT
jgi:hypothetical protein